MGPRAAWVALSVLSRGQRDSRGRPQRRGRRGARLPAELPMGPERGVLTERDDRHPAGKGIWVALSELLLFALSPSITHGGGVSLRRTRGRWSQSGLQPLRSSPHSRTELWGVRPRSPRTVTHSKDSGRWGWGQESSASRQSSQPRSSKTGCAAADLRGDGRRPDVSASTECEGFLESASLVPENRYVRCAVLRA